MPYPFGPVNGSRHDSFVLRESEIIDILRDLCQRLGQDYVLFGDSAYPISRWLWRMYKGVMTVFQAAFNMDMSPARVSVEWGFGLIVQLWPFSDYRKKLKVLLSSVGLYFGVANILTHMHTCLYGNIVQRFAHWVVGYRIPTGITICPRQWPITWVCDISRPMSKSLMHIAFPAVYRLYTYIDGRNASKYGVCHIFFQSCALGY